MNSAIITLYLLVQSMPLQCLEPTSEVVSFMEQVIEGADLPSFPRHFVDEWARVLENPNSSKEQVESVLRKIRNDKKAATQLMDELYNRNVYHGSRSISEYLFAIEKLGGLASPGISKMIFWIENYNTYAWRNQFLGHAVLAKRVIEESMSMTAEEKSKAFFDLAMAIKNNKVLQDLLNDGSTQAAAAVDRLIVEFENERQHQELLAELARYNITFGSSYDEHIIIVRSLIAERVPAEQLYAYLRVANAVGEMSEQEVENLLITIVKALSEYTTDLPSDESRRNRVKAEEYLIDVLLASKGRSGSPNYSDTVRAEAVRAITTINGVRGIPALITELERSKTSVIRRSWHHFFTGGTIETHVYKPNTGEILESITALAKQNERWKDRPSKFPADFFPSIELNTLDVEAIRKIENDTDVADSVLRAKASEALEALVNRRGPYSLR